MTHGEGESRSSGEDGVSDNLLRIELITHFHRNPGLDCTPGEIAEAIGRDEQRVERQLRKLARLHILDECLCNGRCRYRYVPPYSVAAYVFRRSSR